jgi:hypothetical protein
MLPEAPVLGYPSRERADLGQRQAPHGSEGCVMQSNSITPACATEVPSLEIRKTLQKKVSRFNGLIKPLIQIDFSREYRKYAE